MALDESAVSALLDALRAGEGTDLVRELAQWALLSLASCNGPGFRQLHGTIGGGVVVGGVMLAVGAGVVKW